MKKIYNYMANCFLLLIPIFIWNIVFAKSLPRGYQMDIFWKDIPAIIGNTENILRMIVFILPLIMSLSFQTKVQKIGLLIYLIGITVYFIAWLLQIYLPESVWSKSIIGFMAPAYTTIIWFVGIALMGKSSFLKIPYIPNVYLVFSVAFVLIHTYHCYIIYQRLQ